MDVVLGIPSWYTLIFNSWPSLQVILISPLLVSVVSLTLALTLTIVDDVLLFVNVTVHQSGLLLTEKVPIPLVVMVDVLVPPSQP